MWGGVQTSRAASINIIPARGARTTRGRTWVLLHSETFVTRNEAMSREWHLKRERAFLQETGAIHAKLAA